METRTAQAADVFVTHDQKEALTVARHHNGERFNAELPRDRSDALNRRAGEPFHLTPRTVPVFQGHATDASDCAYDYSI